MARTPGEGADLAAWLLDAQKKQWPKDRITVADGEEGISKAQESGPAGTYITCGPQTLQMVMFHRRPEQRTKECAGERPPRHGAEPEWPPSAGPGWRGAAGRERGSRGALKWQAAQTVWQGGSTSRSLGSQKSCANGKRQPRGSHPHRLWRRLREYSDPGEWGLEGHHSVYTCVTAHWRKGPPRHFKNGQTPDLNEHPDTRSIPGLAPVRSHRINKILATRGMQWVTLGPQTLSVPFLQSRVYN